MQILQILTTGYHPKRDAIFAYGCYDTETKTSKIYLAEDLSTWSEKLEQLTDELLKVQRDHDKVIMFNGLSELSFLNSRKFSANEFYHQCVLDLYREILKLKELTTLPNLKLQTIASVVEPEIKVLSSPKLFKLWEKAPDAFDLRLLEDRLKAIDLARRYLNDLHQSMTRDSIAIESFDGNRFFGTTKSRDRFFNHSDYYLYEEMDGQFTLELYPQEIAYDEARRCTYLMVDQNFTNPVPMPEGFLLICLEKQLNIEGILDLIAYIQTLKIQA